MKQKYLSMKDGWEQYWEMLRKEPDNEEIVKAMKYADLYASKQLVLSESNLLNFFFYDLPWKIAFNRSLKGKETSFSN